MFGGHLVFEAPYILGFLALLPAIWWLLRLLPPAPRKLAFPALMLLRGLAAQEKTPARTPLWILLLRLAIAALVVIACAGPRLDPGPAGTGGGAVLIAVDNDWAAARAWDARQEALRVLIEEARRAGRDVILLPTTTPADGEALQIAGPMAAEAARSHAARILPMPWPADWRQATALVAGFDCASVSAGIWLNGGLGGGGTGEFYAALKSCARNVRVLNDSEAPVYLLAPPKNGGGENSVAVFRADTDAAAQTAVLALSKEGRVLMRLAVEFAAGSPRAGALFDLPPDLRNRAVRLEIEGFHTAAATALLDESWQQRSTGLIGDKAGMAEHSFLSGLFYIDRALKPYADLHIGALDELLAQNMAVLIATDDMPPAEAEIPALLAWIKKGGVFVRFAGERLAAGQNPHETELLPVMLRTGDRAMGGAFSWAAPQKLRAFPPSSPFYGLALPEDVEVSRQILAEPAADLQRKTWAALADETPLVTARNIGGGLSILFHVPARSDWSNLPLSGLFVDMLRRIAELGRLGAAAGGDFSALAPLAVLDAFGETQKPGAAVRPVEGTDFSRIAPEPQHPPGIYGSAGGLRRAFNLGEALGPPAALRNIPAESYRPAHHASDLGPWLLATAFALLLLDFLLSLWLRGIVNFPRALRGAAKILPLVFLIAPFHCVPAAADDGQAVELTSKTYLAYRETGKRAVDKVSQAGLEGLARVLERRTSLDHVGVAPVDPESGELAFFPLIYWPLDPAQPPLSPKAARRVNDYLHHGGMILFDSGGDEIAGSAMKTALAGVDLPPLARIPGDHVLRRSFYLLDEFPGRAQGGGLWLEPAEVSSYDGVASVLAGTSGWAAAWAVGADGRPLFPCTPGGEAQREMAYRFGVNVVMYALTGNYKSDQLHAQALLEKLGK